MDIIPKKNKEVKRFNCSPSSKDINLTAIAYTLKQKKSVKKKMKNEKKKFVLLLHPKKKRT